MVKIEESGWIDAERLKRYLESNIYIFSIGLDVGGKGNVVVEDDTINDFSQI